MKNFLTPLLLSLCVFLSAQVYALELTDAKQQGLVGEQADGALGAVSTATPAVQALIEDINRRRTAAYVRIAKKNSTSVDAVRQLAGKKAIEKTRSGQYVKPAGSWIIVP